MNQLLRFEDLLFLVLCRRKMNIRVQRSETVLDNFHRLTFYGAKIKTNLLTETWTDSASWSQQETPSTLEPENKHKNHLNKATRARYLSDSKSRPMTGPSPMPMPGAIMAWYEG